MRLLLVEDFEPLRESLRGGLTGMGFVVDASGDGGEGAWFALNSDYDLLILDIMLPGLTGLEILRRVRAAGRDVPVLLLTARDGIEDRVEGLDLGADDYLVKPFAVSELLARVRSLTRRRHGIGRPVVRVADLEVDTVKRTVHRGGEAVQLTPREFALLEYLILRCGAVVTRLELWEHLWDFTADTDSNAVDVFVSRLRRKLARPGAGPLIHTRRGHGYLLAEHGEPA